MTEINPEDLTVLPYNIVPDGFMEDVVEAEITQAGDAMSPAWRKLIRHNTKGNLEFLVAYMEERGFVFAVDKTKFKDVLPSE